MHLPGRCVTQASRGVAPIHGAWQEAIGGLRQRPLLGAADDETLGDQLRVTVISTGPSMVQIPEFHQETQAEGALVP